MTRLNTTLARTINTSLSTLIVLLCIFILGGDSIRSFRICDDSRCCNRYFIFSVHCISDRIQLMMKNKKTVATTAGE